LPVLIFLANGNILLENVSLKNAKFQAESPILEKSGAKIKISSTYNLFRQKFTIVCQNSAGIRSVCRKIGTFCPTHF